MRTPFEEYCTNRQEFVSFYKKWLSAKKDLKEAKSLRIENLANELIKLTGNMLDLIQKDIRIYINNVEYSNTVIKELTETAELEYLHENS